MPIIYKIECDICGRIKETKYVNKLKSPYNRYNDTIVCSNECEDRFYEYIRKQNERQQKSMKEMNRIIKEKEEWEDYGLVGDSITIAEIKRRMIWGCQDD